MHTLCICWNIGYTHLVFLGKQHCPKIRLPAKVPLPQMEAQEPEAQPRWVCAVAVRCGTDITAKVFSHSGHGFHKKMQTKATWPECFPP